MRRLLFRDTFWLYRYMKVKEKSIIEKTKIRPFYQFRNFMVYAKYEVDK